MKILKNDPDDIVQLAYDLTKFGEDYDPYGFDDAYDSFEAGYDDNFYALSAGGAYVDGILEYMDLVIEEDEDPSFVHDAINLRKRVEKFL